MGKVVSGEVWETAGVWAIGTVAGTHKGWVSVREIDDSLIQLRIGDKSAVITAHAARRLAKQLTKAAKRTDTDGRY